MTTTALTPEDTADNTARAVAMFGGVSTLVYAIAFALSPAGALDSASSGAQITHFASTHRTQLLVSDLLLAAGVATLMVFAAGLYRMIRCTERDGGWLAMSSLATAVAGAGVFGAGTALFMAVAYRPNTDPAVVRALWDAGWMAYNSAGFAFGAWFAIVTAATLTQRMLPLWTAWLGVPIALISLAGPLAVQAGTGAFSPQGPFALLAGLVFALWLIVVSLGAWRMRAQQ